MREFGKDLTWRHTNHPLTIGKALERAGLYRVTLPYYEFVAASTLLSERVRNLAWERWIRTKGQQAQHEKQSGKNNRWEKHVREAASRAEKLGYRSFDEIPVDLPSLLPKVDPWEEPTPAQVRHVKVAEQNPMSTPPPQSDSSVRTYDLDENIGPFRVRVSSDGKRMNIEHGTTLEQLAIKVPSQTVLLEGETIAPDHEGRVSLGSWDLVVHLSRIENGKISLERANGMETSIPVYGRSPETKE